ncbi:MAG: hypothetical protein KDE47_34165 [Caldilineaceae bacterium]|nr:hypothetical protein [Caldilineaceae bacterium]
MMPGAFLFWAGGLDWSKLETPIFYARGIPLASRNIANNYLMLSQLFATQPDLAITAVAFLLSLLAITVSYIMLSWR